MSLLFEERLSPGPASLFVALVFGALLGVILMPVDTTVGLIIALVGALVMPMLLWVTSPRVTVSRDAVRAGRAHIEPQFLGDATALDRDAMAQVLGPQIDPRDFRVVRGWIGTGVRVLIDDPDDPTPAWTLSLRDPKGFVTAVHAAQKANASTVKDSGALDRSTDPTTSHGDY